MPELENELNNNYKIYKERQASHIQLKNNLSGIVIGDEWVKVALDTTNFGIRNFGGFSFDDANDRIYWDFDGTYNTSLPCTFIGDAGIIVTAGLSGESIISMGLAIDGVVVIETHMTFSALDKIGTYGANGLLVNGDPTDLLQSGSYYEFWAKASPGDTLTVAIDYLYTTIKRD